MLVDKEFMAFNLTFFQWNWGKICSYWGSVFYLC